MAKIVGDCVEGFCSLIVVLASRRRVKVVVICSVLVDQIRGTRAASVDVMLMRHSATDHIDAGLDD